jgi:hypothetical protein
LLVVAGFTLKCIEPRVWDINSPYYLPELKAVMVSYAEIHQMRKLRRTMMDEGIHSALNIPVGIKIFLDNGAFSLSRKGMEISIPEYEEFVKEAKPDWRPVPQDFIPAPNMSLKQQKLCLQRTMKSNVDFQHDGFVPVIHVSRVINIYIKDLKSNENLMAKSSLAIGGIVPNLLRAPKALAYTEILKSLINIRREFADKLIHIFGIGGTATLHLASLLKMDSVDSSGWRNRAARGIIQLPGSGERTIAQLGSWNGRKLNEAEVEKLAECKCPVCQRYGLEGLTAKASIGFRNRATHNLWVLLQEELWINKHLKRNSYKQNYQTHLDNTIYRPLIEFLVQTSL